MTEKEERMVNKALKNMSIIEYERYIIMSKHELLKRIMLWQLRFDKEI